MADQEYQKLEPRVSVDIELFTGGKIGTMTVLSDFSLQQYGNEIYLKKVLEESIRSCVDRLILEGSTAIANKHRSNTPKE